ncbi:MAG: SMP-30/gluconolactonase/LRE family protein [Phycisphaerae bacterium]
MSLDVEVVLPLHAQLGEGALWHAPSHRLYWVDILGCKVFAYDPATGQNYSWDTPSHVGTVVVREKGGPAGSLLLALATGFAELDLATGLITPWVNPEAGQTFNRFNDGKCDPAGRFWAGTMRYDFKQPSGNLWCLYPDRHVELKIPGITCSNGIVWSPDARIMYYIDTPTHQLWAFDYDLATGNISNRRTIVEVPANFGGLDGMAIDAAGFLWIAIWGGGKIVRFDPHDGSIALEIPIPGARRITSCAFAGPNLDQLYITSSGADTDPRQEPNAGDLFRVTAPVRGTATFTFQG